jgi:hypothetical protein
MTMAAISQIWLLPKQPTFSKSKPASNSGKQDNTSRKHDRSTTIFLQKETRSQP